MMDADDRDEPRSLAVNPPPSVVRFQTVALGYCRWLESGEGGGAEPLLRWFADLLSAAVDLPESRFTDEDSPEPPTLAVDSARVLAHLREWLSHDYYYAAGPPVVLREDTNEPPPLGFASLFDDVLETYQDLRIGLHQADLDRLDDAVFDWRWGFGAHWGGHATSALVALQELIGDERRRLLKRGS